jgi:hypothetical protein
MDGGHLLTLPRACVFAILLFFTVRDRLGFQVQHVLPFSFEKRGQDAKGGAGREGRPLKNVSSMHKYIYIYTYYIYTFLYIYIYIYTCIHIVYIYIHV